MRRREFIKLAATGGAVVMGGAAGFLIRPALDHKVKRVLSIVTDSQGMPRMSEVPVEETWVARVINSYSDRFEIFTTMQRGLMTNQLLVIAEELTLNYKPALTIMQLGIVDAIEQVTNPSVDEQLIPNTFHNNMYEFLFQMQGSTNALIGLAGPGKALVEAHAAMKDEIDRYNTVLMDLTKQWIPNNSFLDPYGSIPPDDYLVEDGVHLNSEGHRLVFEKVSAWLDTHV